MFSAIKHFIPGDWDGVNLSHENSAESTSVKPADPEPSAPSKLNLPQWNQLLSLAKESTSKVAGEISSAAKELSDKFLHSAPFMEFTRAQSAFEAKKTQDASVKSGLPPWHPDSTGIHDQSTVDLLREQILALPQDERNFLRAPPSGSAFSWDSEKSAELLSTAATMLQEDKNLALMRFRLVPKKLKEDDFWRNYFYRISLIRQAAQLSLLANVTPEDAMLFNSAGDEALSDDNDDDDLEAELLMELENMETKGGAAPDTSDPKERGREEEKKDAGSGEGSFISVDDELERELLAEIEEEEAVAAAAAAADSKKSS